MAELIDIRICPKPTFFHRMDARVKVIALMAISLALFNSGFYGLLSVSGLLALATGPLHRSLWQLFFSLKFFFLILFGVLVARSVSTPGQPLLSFWHLTITQTGLSSGALICWRIILIVLLSYIVTATTPAARIRAAVHWLLHFIPFLPARVISDMIGLLIQFLPAILLRAQLIADAQRARGIDGRKSPIYRIRVFSSALLRSSFLSADRLGTAMVARCYNLDRETPSWPFKRSDLGWILCTILLSSILFIF